MNPRILICLDSESIQYPALLSLEGERIDQEQWILCVSDAAKCREKARVFSWLEEAWFVSCDDMDAINVAAAVKYDNPHLKVVYVASHMDGSLASRVRCAGIDELWDKHEFIQAYSDAKKAHLGMDPLQSPFYQNVGAGVPVSSQSVASFSSSCFVMPIVSGSGGTGRSTLTALAGYLLQRNGLKTLIIDADLQFGDLHYLTGNQNPLRLDEVLDLVRRGEMTNSSGSAPMLLAAPTRLEMSEVIEESLPEVIANLSQSYDAIIVNTSSHWGEVQAQLFEVSQRVLMLMDQRPSSLRSCIHVLDLCARMGVPTHSFRYAINKFERRGIMSTTDASCALRGAKVDEIPYGGNEIDEILGAGYPQELLESRNECVRAFEILLMDMVREFMPERVQPGELVKTRKTSFWSWLRGF